MLRRIISFILPRTDRPTLNSETWSPRTAPPPPCPDCGVRASGIANFCPLCGRALPKVKRFVVKDVELRAQSPADALKHVPRLFSPHSPEFPAWRAETIDVTPLSPDTCDVRVRYERDPLRV